VRPQLVQHAQPLSLLADEVGHTRLRAGGAWGVGGLTGCSCRAYGGMCSTASGGIPTCACSASARLVHGLIRYIQSRALHSSLRPAVQPVTVATCHHPVKVGTAAGTLLRPHASLTCRTAARLTHLQHWVHLSWRGAVFWGQKV
jgi:hypothetical protein